MLIFVKPKDLTISSSVWPMSIQPSRHLRWGATPPVVSTRAPLDSGSQLPCSVPPTCRRTDTSSSSFRSLTMQTSVNWRSTFAVSPFTCTGITKLIPHRNWKKQLHYVCAKYVYAAPIFLSFSYLSTSYWKWRLYLSLYLTYTNKISLVNINNNEQGGTLPTAV